MKPTAARPELPPTASTCTAFLMPWERPTSTSRIQVAPRTQCMSDRKSTRLNSSHDQISYAVFCLKKKKKKRSHAHRGRDFTFVYAGHVLTRQQYKDPPRTCAYTLACLLPSSSPTTTLGISEFAQP